MFWTWLIFKAVTTLAGLCWHLPGSTFGLAFASVLEGEVGKGMSAVGRTACEDNVVFVERLGGGHNALGADDSGIV